MKKILSVIKWRVKRYLYISWHSWSLIHLVRLNSYRQAKIANVVLGLSVLIAVLITIYLFR